jgi:hypothetical protein
MAGADSRGRDPVGLRACNADGVQLLRGTSVENALSIRTRGLVEPFEGRGVYLNAQDDHEHAE